MHGAGVARHVAGRRVGVGGPRVPPAALPEGARVRHRLPFVGQHDAGPGGGKGVVEDPRHAVEGADVLLDRHLLGRARLEPAAEAAIQALGVLPDHGDVGRPWPGLAQRAQAAAEQPGGPDVRVEIQFAADPPQGLPEVAGVGDPGVADRAEQDRVRGLELREVVLGQRLAGLEVPLRAHIERLELQAELEPSNHPDSGRDHLPADPVTLNHYDLGCHVIKVAPATRPGKQRYRLGGAPSSSQELLAPG